MQGRDDAVGCANLACNAPVHSLFTRFPVLRRVTVRARCIDDTITRFPMRLLAIVETPWSYDLACQLRDCLSPADFELCVALKILLAPAFFGGRLCQRREETSTLVTFAGTVVHDFAGLLRTRLHNKNAQIHSPERTQFVPTICRFRSGFGPQTQSRKMGQLFGHVTRQLDYTNVPGMLWLRADLCLLGFELLQSGWRPQDFSSALRRVQTTHPGLSQVLHDVACATGP